MNNEVCFAKNEHGECIALNETNCKDCRFCRNDIKREDIEKDIKKYRNGEKANGVHQ